MKFDCSYDEMVPIEKLIGHPRNNNIHPPEQIETFARILKAKGVWRYPIVVSKNSGFIISGHGRLEVAKMLELESVPVNYQDFENEADEYQQLTFDNEISRWAKLDRQAVHLALEEIPDLDMELLGIENFNLEVPDMDFDDPPSDEEVKKYLLEIKFTNELDMQDLYDDLISKGYPVKQK